MFTRTALLAKYFYRLSRPLDDARDRLRSSNPSARTSCGSQPSLIQAFRLGKLRRTVAGRAVFFPLMVRDCEAIVSNHQIPQLASLRRDERKDAEPVPSNVEGSGRTASQFYVWLILLFATTAPAYDIKDLTLDEKIGQLFIIAVVADEEVNKEFTKTQPYQMDIEYVAHLITTYHVGGIIFLGQGTQVQVKERMAYFQSISKWPLLGCIDAEWGLAMRLSDGMQFPRAKMLGALDAPMLVETMAYHIGMQCKEIGIQCNFAPVADVNNNPSNMVIKDRSFGATPEVVIENASAYAKGLRNAGVLGCAKHFPGHGDTNVDSHYDLPCIPHNKDRLDQIELAPFASLIQQGIPAIMIAHLEVPALESQAFLPASLSRAIVTDLLRTQMGFNGLIVTDGLGMAGVTKNAQQSGEVELKALLAGNDILLCPVSLESAVALIKEALATGVLSEQELDEHVQRILDAKEWVFTQKDQQSYDSKKALEVKEELDRKVSEISSMGL